jgi:glutamate/aspartate transport system substrate-binding protein
VKAQLQMPRLNVKYTLVTSALRIPMVANGTIDLECGSTTNTLERQAQVAFVDTTFVAATRLMTRKAANITKLEDLKGKLVVAVAGTTNLKHISEVNAKRKLQMKIAPVKDNAKAFSMMESGEAAAFGTDDILLYDMIANSKTPADYVVSKEPLSIEPYGIVLRKDDPEFKKLANDTIEAVFKSGEIKKIYAKWFTSPIPPNNIVLKAEMSDALAKIVSHPTDSALPSDYSDDSFFNGE